MVINSRAREQALRAGLVHRVEDSRHVSRLKMGVVAGILVVGAGSGLAFANIRSEPLVDNGVLHCRSGSSTTSSDVMAQMGATVSEGRLHSLDGQPNPKFGDARAMCESLWRQGILTAGSDFPSDLARPTAGQIPPLVICVGDDGLPVVVPGNKQGICGALGLSAAS